MIVSLLSLKITIIPFYYHLTINPVSQVGLHLFFSPFIDMIPTIFSYAKESKRTCLLSAASMLKEKNLSSILLLSKCISLLISKHRLYHQLLNNLCKPFSLSAKIRVWKAFLPCHWPVEPSNSKNRFFFWRL